MTTSQRVVLFLLAASLLAGVVTGSTLYYRITYVWMILFVGSWVMSRVALRGVKFQRAARSLRAQAGHIFEERFELLNTSRLPRIWLEVRDESPLPGARGSQVLSLIGGKESRIYLVRTRLTERGVFPLGQTVISSGDVFGLFPVSARFPAQESLLVYPMLVDIQSFPSPQGWLSGGEALRRRTHQITANAAGVREYAPGDPLNRIHWLSTARRNRLIVKEFELDPLAEVWIFLDANKRSHCALPRPPVVLEEQDLWKSNVKIPLPPATEEYAVSVAASLARYYLQRGRVVGLVSAGRTFRVLPAERGGRQLGKILENLALLRADGRLPVLGLVDAGVHNLPRGSTVVLITPEYGNEVLLAVETLARRSMRPVVVALDTATFGGDEGAKAMEAQLQALRVPVCRIQNGDDLSAVLTAAGRQQTWL
ncbi:MAG: DUF58 domain-containing protein [Chloroflexi bacterium]|nr:DUF58 domain-containing protein [Chloroflexota bacterium]